MTVGSLVHGTLVSLRSIEATLTTLATKAKDPEAEEAFTQAASKAQKVIYEVEVRKAQIEYEEPQYQQQ